MWSFTTALNNVLLPVFSSAVLYTCILSRVIFLLLVACKQDYKAYDIRIKIMNIKTLGGDEGRNPGGLYSDILKHINFFKFDIMGDL